jgi:hypothetical protein
MFGRVAGTATQLKYENIVYSPEDRFRLQVVADNERRYVLHMRAHLNQEYHIGQQVTDILPCRRAAAGS